jgi:GWxTD domain-containing protein
MKTFLCFAMLIAGVLLVGLQPANGQMDIISSDAPREYQGVLVDYAVFWEPDTGLARLEVYWQVHNEALVFRSKEELYEAQMGVVIRVRNEDGRQVASYQKDRAIALEDESRTKSRRDFRVYQASFLLPPEKYKVEFILSDGESQRAFTRQFEAELENPIGRKPGLSDVELVNVTGKAGPKESPFDKGNLQIIPNLTGEYGASQNNRLRFYFEIYQGDEGKDEIFVETAVRQQWGGLQYRDSMTITLEQPISRQLREISLGNMSPGEYELEVRLRDGRKMRKIDERKLSFFVEWSTDALVRDQYETNLDLLRLIARPGELEGLEDLQSIDERRAALDSFWLEWDPTPGTQLNEIKHEFYRRVKVANRRFAYMRLPGWRTDRGKVFIKHGPPDQVDDYPMQLDGHPYQEWHYHSTGVYKRFTFVDENSDGEYRLVYPYDGLHLRPDF